MEVSTVHPNGLHTRCGFCGALVEANRHAGHASHCYASIMEEPQEGQNGEQENMAAKKVWLRMLAPSAVKTGGLRAKLKQECARVVIAGRFETLAEVRKDHATGHWIQGIKEEFSLKTVNNYGHPPSRVVTAECGAELLWGGAEGNDHSAHQVAIKHKSGCKSCKALQPVNPPPPVSSSTSTPKPGPVEVVYRVPGLEEHSVEGLLSVMRLKSEEALTLAGQMAEAVSVVEVFVAGAQRLTQLRKEQAEHRKALYELLGGDVKEEGGSA